MDQVLSDSIKPEIRRWIQPTVIYQFRESWEVLCHVLTSSVVISNSQLTFIDRFIKVCLGIDRSRNWYHA